MKKKSGIPFQFEVEERIKSLGFETFPDRSYIDDVELKPRDIDIVAIKKVESYKTRDTQLALVVEVKYLSDDAIAYMRDNPRDETTYFIDGFASRDLDYAKKEFHSYTTPQVAINISDKDISGAMLQAIKALFYLRTKPLLYQAGMFYPMVVFKGKKLKNQNGEELKSVLHHRTYEWRNPETGKIDSRSIYVDVIHESLVEDYVTNIYATQFETLRKVIYFQQRMQENQIERSRQDRRNSAM